MNVHAPPPTPNRHNPIAAYFVARWRGDVPLARLFWRDMILTGTLLNVAATVAAIVLLAIKVPAPVAVAVHFMPLPYNIFLFVAVWRTAERNEGIGALPGLARIGSAVWIIIASVV